jgi:hypothetical protein
MHGTISLLICIAADVSATAPPARAIARQQAPPGSPGESPKHGVGGLKDGWNVLFLFTYGLSDWPPTAGLVGERGYILFHGHPQFPRPLRYAFTANRVCDAVHNACSKRLPRLGVRRFHRSLLLLCVLL